MDIPLGISIKLRIELHFPEPSAFLGLVKMSLTRILKGKQISDSVSWIFNL